MSFQETLSEPIPKEGDMMMIEDMVTVIGTEVIIPTNTPRRELQEEPSEEELIRRTLLHLQMITRNKEIDLRE